MCVLNKSLKYNLYKKPNETYSIWNINQLNRVYQGKFMVTLNTNEYYLGHKVGSFIKTRKPCFFRTKKK